MQVDLYHYNKAIVFMYRSKHFVHHYRPGISDKNFRTQQTEYAVVYTDSKLGSTPFQFSLSLVSACEQPPDPCTDLPIHPTNPPAAT